MSYIGRKPTVGNFQICDAISVVNNQAAYTMQVGSVNVIPQSSNHMIVSLNGVIQKPGGANPSFTVSGSTITFASNLSTGDVINFIQILGDVLDLGTPSDNTVTATKLSSNAVTTAKINNDAVTVDKLNLISTGSVPSLEAKGTSGVTEGYIQLNCAENTHGIKIKSPPHSASASYTLTMPNNDGDANQFLQTNGSGVLSFAAAGGKVLQVITAETTTNTQITSTSFADTSLTANITPSATSSKVLILISQNVQMQRDAGNNREITANTKLLRGSTNLGLKTVGIGVGDGMSGVMGSRNTISYAHLDSPNSSSQITYKTTGAANTTDNSATIRFQEGLTSSTIVLIEIAG